MLTGVDGTIKIADDDKVVLEIAQNDLEKFKEYKHSTNPKKFYAGFSLNDRQLYVTGFFTETKDTTVTMLIASAKKQGNEKACTTAAEIKTLLGLDNTKKEVEVQMLPHLQKQLEELKPKIQELEDAKQKAEQENTDLKAEVEKLKAINSTVLQQQLKDKDKEIKTLNAQIEEQKQQVDALAEEKAKVEELNTKIKTLNARLQKDGAELEAKENEITQLKAQNNTQEVANLKKQLEDANQKAEREKKDLQNQLTEAKNKTTEQPKQGNAALYTATAGMGLAAGLIAFTALERTVRLEMLVMIGIAVASALVVGGITYAALPSTQVDGAKAQEVNENGKGK